MVANRKPGCLVKAKVPGYAIALTRRKLLRRLVSEDHMTRRNDRFLVRLAAIAAIGLPLAACGSLGGEEFQRGYLLDQSLLAQVKPGMSGEQVLNSLDLPVRSGEPLAAELDAFLEVVRRGGRPVVDVEDGRWAVVLADALLRAAREQRTIDL